MATTLIRNAQAIVTVDREDRVLRKTNCDEPTCGIAYGPV